MKQKRNWRAIFTWVLLVFAVAYALPSAVEMPSWWPFTKQIRGGLDLAGGLELRYTVGWKESVQSTTYKAAESLQLRIVEELIKKDGKNYADVRADEEAFKAYLDRVSFKVERTDRATVTIADEATWQVFDEMEDPLTAIDDRLEGIESSDDRTITVILPDDVAQEIRAQVVSETRDNLEKRVGGMGLVDPDVRVTGDSDIAVQVPGVDKSQMDVVRSVLGRTAQLTMRFVDKDNPWLLSPEVTTKLDAYKQENPRAASMSAVSHAWGAVIRAKNKSDLARFTRTLALPVDRMIGFNYDEIDTDNDGVIDEKFWQAVFLKSRVRLTGQDLSRARMSYSEEGKPAVYLDMNGEGAQKFADATGENVKEYLAIMLDEDVQSAPIINQKIAGGRAEITMGRGGKRAFDEAQALAGVLNQGAFQAPVYKVHDHAVGPSLGKDSVSAGATALVLGFGLVILFCMFYYRVSGFIAAAVLSFNMLLVFVLLVSFNTALTLPGVAGIILTLGMAVDGNVLIFERIREELRMGKTPRVAVDLGFGKALSSIVDGNITTALTAFVLMNFTSGPIHNFAVTLLIGLATSVFSAVFVSRLIFNYWLASRKPTTISI